MSASYPATMEDIERERTRLRRVLRGHDARSLNRRPPNGAWSPLENVRHLLFAEQLHLGALVSRDVEFSPLGMTGMTAKKFAAVGRRRTSDVDEVFAEWDAIHRAIKNALKTASGLDVGKALWRNHRHLRIHTDVIERLLRRTAGGDRRRAPR